jgi:2-methylcitrate dehydratase PrpD
MAIQFAAEIAARPSVEPCARHFARFALGQACAALPTETAAKARTCLLHALSCALIAHDTPWGRQVLAWADGTGGGRSRIIGSRLRATPESAALANGTLAHGLIHEDMHTASLCHIGVVVIPALLVLGEHGRAGGRMLLESIVAGYQVAGRIGRAVITSEAASLFRPTGLIGPLGGAAGAARLLGLSEDQTISALGFAANMAGGLNEWPHAGGTEVFFHAGLAARSAVTAARLAEAGATASETAIDGRSGLYAAYHRTPVEKDPATGLDDGHWEILDVFVKPAPACNYVQTACQAALHLVEQEGVVARDVESITVRTFPAATAYPGCDYAGPFDGIVQAKMSIQFAVAAVLAHGQLAEDIFRDVGNPEVARLAAGTSFEMDDAFTRAYPQQQGAEVIVRLRNGRRLGHRMADLVPMDEAAVRAHFLAAVAGRLGESRARAILALVDDLDTIDDVGEFTSLLVPEDEEATA